MIDKEKDLANRIRELRNEKKITQLQLSIQLEVTQETISAYEHGKHLPSLSALMKMSEIFDASMDYIIGLSNVRSIRFDIENTSEDIAQKEHLLNCYRKLGSKNKGRLISYAEGLLDGSKD